MAIMKKRSLFERLSGSPSFEDQYYDESFEDTERTREQQPVRRIVPQESTRLHISTEDSSVLEEPESAGQLPVDVYETANELVIRAFVAGVRADELNVAISRDMVVIEGSREEREQLPDSDYFIRELFWGAFSRTIMLPQEVDVDNSSAGSRDGLLTIVMPKLDRSRQTKLKVRSS